MAVDQTMPLWYMELQKNKTKKECIIIIITPDQIMPLWVMGLQKNKTKNNVLYIIFCSIMFCMDHVVWRDGVATREKLATRVYLNGRESFVEQGSVCMAGPPPISSIYIGKNSEA